MKCFIPFGIDFKFRKHVVFKLRSGSKSVMFLKYQCLLDVNYFGTFVLPKFIVGGLSVEAFEAPEAEPELFEFEFETLWLGTICIDYYWIIIHCLK